MGPGGEALPFLDKVEKTVLLASSWRDRLEVKPLDLNHTVTEIGPLLAVSIAKTVTLSYQLEQDIPSSELLVAAAAPVPVPEESPLACRVLLVVEVMKRS